MRKWRLSSIGLLVGALVLLLIFMVGVLDQEICCEPDPYGLDQIGASHG